MPPKIDFYELEEVRIASGLFFDQAIQELGITRRTWYRWKRLGEAPYWAYKLIKLLGGDLEYLGWKRWRIHKGRLYNADLNPRFYAWSPGDVMASIVCSCPARSNSRKLRIEASAGEKVVGLMGVNPQGRSDCLNQARRVPLDSVVGK